MSTQAIVKTKVTPNLDLKEPPLYRVIYLNDNVTTVEFVVESLIKVFGCNLDEATMITQKIHEEGSATVDVLPYEVAEQKGIEVTQLARNNGYPLNIKIEPDE